MMKQWSDIQILCSVITTEIQVLLDQLRTEWAWLKPILDNIQCIRNTVEQAVNAIPRYHMNLMDVVE